jgi:hypothetical protein
MAARVRLRGTAKQNPSSNADMSRLFPGRFLDILLDILRRLPVSGTPQKRALKNYRKRLASRGLARFEVLGLAGDRELIRSLAKRLARDDAEATRIRAGVRESVAEKNSKKGGIWEALRRSPLVGADIDFTREVTYGRKIDL